MISIYKIEKVENLKEYILDNVYVLLLNFFGIEIYKKLKRERDYRVVDNIVVLKEKYKKKDIRVEVFKLPKGVL